MKLKGGFKMIPNIVWLNLYVMPTENKASKSAIQQLDMLKKMLSPRSMVLMTMHMLNFLNIAWILSLPTPTALVIERTDNNRFLQLFVCYTSIYKWICALLFCSQS